MIKLELQFRCSVHGPLESQRNINSFLINFAICEQCQVSAFALDDYSNFNSLTTLIKEASQRSIALYVETYCLHLKCKYLTRCLYVKRKCNILIYWGPIMRYYEEILRLMLVRIYLASEQIIGIWRAL